MKEFTQIEWDDVLEDDCRQLVRLGVREDLDRSFDWTTACLVEPQTDGRAAVVTRAAGVACGLRAAKLALSEIDPTAQWETQVDDGRRVSAGQTIAVLQGPARSLLSAERLLLNIIGRLSGVASLAHRYVETVAATKARIFDTRKTTVGWRRLEKYAVRQGGGFNHRTGLFDAILIKDNHLALSAITSRTPAAALAQAKAFLATLAADDPRSRMIVEVEVDALDQLEAVLPIGPDIVLLDNMTCEQLQKAVARRDEVNPVVQLEASGGVTLDTVGEIARTGVDRISVGALTHSANWLDVGLDWLA